jgi:peptide/nickel transport system permease protein
VVSYIIRRLFGAVLTLVIVSMITFGIFYLVPRWAGGTPESLASRYVGRTANAQQVAEAAHGLGLDKPFFTQYWDWFQAIFVGRDFAFGATQAHCPAPCLGYSFIGRNPVLPDILDRLPVTASLAFGAAIIWVIFGVATGVLSALRRGSIFDRMAMGVALGGVSLPIFWTGLVSLVLFSYTLHWTAPGSSYTPIEQNPGEWAYDLILPWITLALLFSAAYARLTRAGMLETMGEDYIRTARAKGLKEHTVVTRHGLRAALTPIATIFGLDVGLLLGGAVLTESTFGLQGIGKYAIDAISANDMPKVMGFVLFAAGFVVIANLIVDVVYAVIDPRVRLA